MFDAKADSKQDAQNGDHNVGPAQELILATDPCCCGKDDLLLAIKCRHRKDVVHVKVDSVAFLEVHVDDAVKLAEVWET